MPCSFETQKKTLSEALYPDHRCKDTGTGFSNTMQKHVLNKYLKYLRKIFSSF